MGNPRTPLPPVEVLEEWFSYDEAVGELRWRKSPYSKKGWEGRLAGGRDRKGYVRVRFQGKKLAAHRIAFKMSTGLEPPVELDHRDGNHGNNRLSNLRVPEFGDNPANGTLRSCNTSGHVGVSWSKRMRLWVAAITRHRVVHQATFLTKEEAIAWRLQQEVELHGEFAQHRRNGAPNVPLQVQRRSTRRCNTSGVEGVSWVKRDKRWRARIRRDGREVVLFFRTKEEAIAQRKAWEAERDNKPEKETK